MIFCKLPNFALYPACQIKGGGHSRQRDPCLRFAADVQLKPAYALAQAMDDKSAARAIVAAAKRIAAEQQALRTSDSPALPAADVLRRLLDAPRADSVADVPRPFVWTMPHGRPALSVQFANRQDVTVRLHAGSRARIDDMANALCEALRHLEREGRGLQP